MINLGNLITSWYPWYQIFTGYIWYIK